MSKEQHEEILASGSEKFGLPRRAYMETLDYLQKCIAVNRDNRRTV